MRKRSQHQIEAESIRFRVRFGRERASHQPCHSLGLSNDRQSASGSGDVSLTIYIISMSSGKSLAHFTNHIFHFNRPPGLRGAFDAVESSGRFGRIQCQRSEKSASRG